MRECWWVCYAGVLGRKEYETIGRLRVTKSEYIVFFFFSSSLPFKKRVDPKHNGKTNEE